MKLVNAFGEIVTIGEVVQLRDGKFATITGWAAPKHSGSTGRIFVRADGLVGGEFFPQVFGCQFVTEGK